MKGDMERMPYPSDLTDEQWKLVELHTPPAKWGGRPREVDMREILALLRRVHRRKSKAAIQGWR